MIDVSCEFCFRKYRVKPEFAGKKFKCKQCEQLVSVPAAAPRPARSTQPVQRDPWDDMDLDAGMALDEAPVVRRKTQSGGSSKRKRKRASSDSSMSSSVIAVICVGGVIGLGMIIGLFVPAVMAVTALIAVIIGGAVAVVGGIMVMVSAFQEDIMCGILYLFVPFYALYYLITRWSEVGKYFLMALGGYVLIILGVIATGANG